jgi:hypothetical protein
MKIHSNHRPLKGDEQPQNAKRSSYSSHSRFFSFSYKRTVSDDEDEYDKEADQNGDTNVYGDEDVAEDDYDNARQQQRVEVELNMPALPIPDSEDGKVRDLGEWARTLTNGWLHSTIWRNFRGSWIST